VEVEAQNPQQAKNLVVVQMLKIAQLKQQVQKVQVLKQQSLAHRRKKGTIMFLFLSNIYNSFPYSRLTFS